MINTCSIFGFPCLYYVNEAKTQSICFDIKFSVCMCLYASEMRKHHNLADHFASSLLSIVEIQNCTLHFTLFDFPLKRPFLLILIFVIVFLELGTTFDDAYTQFIKLLNFYITIYCHNSILRLIRERTNWLVLGRMLTQSCTLSD